MKNFLQPLALILFLTISSCSGNSPENVAKSFFDNMYSGNFEAAKEYGTTDTKSMLSMMESFGAKDQFKDKMKDADVKVEVLETNVDGDAATCKLKISDSKSDKTEEVDVKLKKVDGKWLVDMKKEDTKKEG